MALAPALPLVAAVQVDAAASGTEPCCGVPPEDGPALVRCANESAPALPKSWAEAVSRSAPVVLVMQLSTPNLWTSFAKFTAATNAAWARRHGHRYLLTAGEFLSRADLWRGGNVRAVYEVLNAAPEEVEWVFHLDSDASIVDFSDADALSQALARFGSAQTEVLLSRDESGFAGNSRLVNMGTGLWRRSAWTKRLLRRWWAELSSTARNEQEVLELLLRENALGCRGRITLLPAGFLNSESANAVAASPARQPVVHLAGMPSSVRDGVFGAVWAEVCGAPGRLPLGLRGHVAEDVWGLRELFVSHLVTHAENAPDEVFSRSVPLQVEGSDGQEDAKIPAGPAGSPWAVVSEPARAARRAALALLGGRRRREEAERFARLSLRRISILESRVTQRAPGFGAEFEAPLAQFVESLAGPLLELGHTAEAAAILQRPRTAAAGPRHALDELVLAENLGAALVQEGRLSEAEPLARRALAGLELAFPAGVRDVRPAAARARLAHIRHLRGDVREAEALLRRAFADYEESLGGEHPQTLGCARNLAVLLKQIAGELGPRQREALQESDALFVRAAEGLAASLGEGHPDAVRATTNLANFRRWRRLHAQEL